MDSEPHNVTNPHTLLRCDMTHSYTLTVYSSERFAWVVSLIESRTLTHLYTLTVYSYERFAWAVSLIMSRTWGRRVPHETWLLGR